MTGIFTASSVLTASALNTAINSLTLNAQTGTTYTFVLTDAGKLVTASNASAQTYTIPLNSSVAYAVGTDIEVLNISTGTVTISPTGGVTLNGITSVGAGQRVRLSKTATDTWYCHPIGGGGLSLITTTTFSAAATVSVNNCFTTAFDNYRVVITHSGSAATTLFLRMRAAAADNSTANYVQQYIIAQSTTVSGASVTGATSCRIGSVDLGSYNGQAIDIFYPQAAQNTRMTGLEITGLAAPVTAVWGDAFTATTQFDGFTIFPTTGTITGTIRVYGYSN